MSDRGDRNLALQSHEFGAGGGKLRNGVIIGALIVAVGLWAFLIAGDSLPDGKPLTVEGWKDHGMTMLTFVDVTDSLQVERASLLEKNERARNRVEAMLMHLNSLEQGT